ncbi:CvpA family protein, partial [Evtepia gabavorous]
MELTVSLLLDLVILGLLLYCLIQGLRRGFILTLCSLLAVLLAFLGGWYLATHAAQPLEEKLEPVILHAMLAQEESEAADSPEQTDLPSQSEQANPSENGLFHRFPQSLQDQLTQTTEDWKQATRAELAAAAAGLLARSLLFLAGFFGVLILWLILCHTLNLVAKLPGLHLLNKLLGGLLGLIKGLLLLMVARWILCDLLGWIPASIA